MVLHQLNDYLNDYLNDLEDGRVKPAFGNMYEGRSQRNGAANISNNM